MRGQISQLFIYISALLVIGVTVLIGMRLFSTVQQTACVANDAKLLQQVRDTLERASTYGSREQAQLRITCAAKALCFVDKDAIGDATFQHPDPVIQSSIREGVKENVFAIGEATIPVGYDERIITRQPGDPLDITASWVCTNATRSGYAVLLEGYGRYIKVSP